MKRVLRLARRFSRKVAAALLGLTLAAPSFAAAETARSCCCLHAERKCHCPVCEHARELESGQRHLRRCGDSQPAATVIALPDALPPSSDAEPPLQLLATPVHAPIALHQAP